MRRRVLILIVLAVLPLGVEIARGERVKQGDLLLSFDLTFEPKRLPRERSAPVSIDLRGSVDTASGDQPPQLRSIRFDVNSYGQIHTRGLPTCPRGALEAASTEIALERCRGALVGHGRFGANVDFEGREPFPVEGKILAFNGRAGGRPTIFLHIYGSRPVEATIVLSFKIAHHRGRYGTSLSTRTPKIASDLGYVTDVSLTLGRMYRYAGEKRSFLTARCAAPDGFPGVTFPLARGTFKFANGQEVGATLTRSCQVR